MAIALNNLALLLKEKGDYAKAEPLYRQSLAIRGGSRAWTIRVWRPL